MKFSSAATFIKNILLCAALLASVLLPAFLPAIASAHILETDGTMGAVLHIDPDDDPIAASPAHFFFQFKNTAGPFDIADCNCSVVVQYPQDPSTGSQQPALFSLHILGGTTTNQLAPSVNPTIAADTLTFFYTFPQEAVYIVTVDGTSTATSTARSFPSFHLSYDIRVDRQASASAGPSELQALFQEHITHLIIVLVGIGVGVVITILDKKKKKKVE